MLNRLLRDSTKAFRVIKKVGHNEQYPKKLFVNLQKQATKLGDEVQNFIENDYLFSSDNNLDSRFINLAPFSKFYLSIDNDSPSMIGKFIGWKIVKSFMKVNSSNLNELIQYDPMYIYNNSKYKPSNYE